MRQRHSRGGGRPVRFGNAQEIALLLDICLFSHRRQRARECFLKSLGDNDLAMQCSKLVGHSMSS